MVMRRCRDRRRWRLRSENPVGTKLGFLLAALLAGSHGSAQTVATPGELESAEAPAPLLGEGEFTETITEDDAEQDSKEVERLIWEDPDGPKSRELAYLEFKTHIEAEQLPQAVEAAQLVVELTEKEFGPNHIEVVTPLNNLATVQEQLGEYPAAEGNYRRSIKILEGAQGIYGERLVRPLTGLGLVYNAAGRYPEGLLVFQRAQHITHRNDGMYALDQLDILDGQTQSFLGLDEFAEADRTQRLALVVSERKLGKRSLGVVPALYKLGKWYQQTYQYTNQRILYRRALDILEAHHGPDDLSLVEPLRGIATSRYLEGIRRTEGERALERALEIVNKHPDVDSEERVRTLVDLGDWYITSSKADAGLPLYRQAWNLLHGNLKLRESLFGRPVRLLYYSPVITEGEPLSISNEPGEKYIDLEFMVTRRGRVANVKVVDANVRNIIQREVKFAASKARYRPRLENGVSVDTPVVRFRQSFKNPRLDSDVANDQTSSRSATAR